MMIDSITATIAEQFEWLRTRGRSSGLSGLRMAPCLINVVVVSLVKALERFESFHESDNSEAHKQAAFSSYWLSKVKPIVTETYHRHTMYITVNESFAFMLALHLLGINQRRISDEFMEEFVYSLYFRDTSPRQMFYTFAMLDRLNKAVPGTSVII